MSECFGGPRESLGCFGDIHQAPLWLTWIEAAEQSGTA
jgi:hypothetical protein